MAGGREGRGWIKDETGSVGRAGPVRPGILSKKFDLILI